jgi:hypothetical protein
VKYPLESTPKLATFADDGARPERPLRQFELDDVGARESANRRRNIHRNADAALKLCQGERSLFCKRRHDLETVSQRDMNPIVPPDLADVGEPRLLPDFCLRQFEKAKPLFLKRYEPHSFVVEIPDTTRFGYVEDVARIVADEQDCIQRDLLARETRMRKIVDLSNRRVKVRLNDCVAKKCVGHWYCNGAFCTGNDGRETLFKLGDAHAYNSGLERM